MASGSSQGGNTDTAADDSGDDGSMTFDTTKLTEGDPSLNLSFAGCGFLGIYHLGVASTFQKHGRKLLEDVTRYTGASAGALVASVLAIKGHEPKVIEVRCTPV